MGDLDPIRAPERKRFFVSLSVGVCVVLGLIMFLSWWLQSPMPRVLIVIAVAALVGWIGGRTLFRRKK